MDVKITMGQRILINITEKSDVENRYEVFNNLIQVLGFRGRGKVFRDRLENRDMSVKLPQEAPIEVCALLGRLADVVSIQQWRDWREEEVRTPTEKPIYYTQYRYQFRGLKARVRPIKEKV